MRKRFALNANSCDDFLRSCYSDMWNPSVVGEFRVKLNTLGLVSYINTPAGGRFRNQNLLPQEYWKKYIETLLQSVPENLHVDKYENLIHHFDITVLESACFLGSKKKEFLNMNDKVGWIPQD